MKEVAVKNKFKSRIFRLLFAAAVLAGLLGIGLGIIAMLCSTAISVGMIIPVLGGILLVIWGFIRLIRPGPALKYKALRRAVIICVCAVLLAAVFFEALILSALTAPKPDVDPDFVLVLGCGIFPDGTLTYSLKSRLDSAYNELLSYPGAICIVSGGRGGSEPVPEARAMYQYLVSCGINEDRIIMEPRSRNTAENMKYSAAIINDNGGGTAAVVTSDYHVYRALVTAKRYGVDAYGIGAPTNWRILAACHIREYVGIIKEALAPNE